METVWERASATVPSVLAINSDMLDPEFFHIIPPGDSDAGPTVNTTGLGLPLSRALAKAGGGWLGLFEAVGVSCLNVTGTADVTIFGAIRSVLVLLSVRALLL